MKINNDKDRQEFITKLNAVDLSKPWQVDAKPYVKNRSKEQNRLLYKWYGEIGKQSGNGVQYERNYCKFTFGMPILISDDDFKGFYTDLICNLTYEQAIRAMEYLSISSLMSSKQFTDYLESIEKYAISNQYKLTIPEENL